MMAGTAEDFSVYVSNLDPSTSREDMEELIYELFLQAGPLEKVYLPSGVSTGTHRGYGFVEFLHKESVQYSIRLLHGIHLLKRPLNVNTVAQKSQKSPSSSSTVDKTPPPATQRLHNPFLDPPISSSSSGLFSTFNMAHLVGAMSPSSSSSSSLFIPSLFPPAHSATAITSPSAIPGLFSAPLSLPPMSPAQLYTVSPSQGATSNKGVAYNTAPVAPLQENASSSHLLPTPSTLPLQGGASILDRLNYFLNQPPSNHPLNGPCYSSSPSSSCPLTSPQRGSDGGDSDISRRRGRCVVARVSPYNASHRGVHQARLNANDYPAWVSKEVREKMFHYHLNKLEGNIRQLKSTT